MKTRTKVQLFVAGLLLFGVGCGGWFLFRGSMLRAGLEGALGRLHSLGVGTQVGEISWDGLWTARIDLVKVVGAGNEGIELRNIVVHLAPALSFSGREWVNGVEASLRGLGDDALNRGLGVGNDALHRGLGAGEGLGGEAVLRGLGGEAVLRRAGDGWGFVLRDLWVQHSALGENRLQLGELAGWCRVEAADGRLALRPGSCIRWGDAWTAVSGYWDRKGGDFAFDGVLPLQSVQRLLDPVGNIAPSWLGGIRANGAVNGYFSVSGDLDSLGSLQLDGDLDGQSIAVTQYGAVDLDSLRIVASNPDFVGLGEMPQYLVQAVVLSEDAGFWEHKGFDKEIIRMAVIENVEEGRFARGAGTIPMQLVRNVFLHHGKQLDRKLAEVVLTWLGEEQKVLTKEEELMVYLNVIEWGIQGDGLAHGRLSAPGEFVPGRSSALTDVPGSVDKQEEESFYGIRAAADHYFHKAPKALTVDEAIFLACVIPNPRHAAALLEADGSLTPYAQEYFDSMRWMLYDGDWIGEEWLGLDTGTRGLGQGASYAGD